MACLFGEQVLSLVSAKLLPRGLFCDISWIVQDLDVLKNTLKFIGLTRTKTWWSCDYVDSVRGINNWEEFWDNGPWVVAIWSTNGQKTIMKSNGKASHVCLREK